MGRDTSSPLPIDRSCSRWISSTNQARHVIPGDAQTESKSLFQFTRGVSPTRVVRAENSHFWDADGNEYIDYLTRTTRQF